MVDDEVKTAIDTLSDWIERLRKARKLKAAAEAKETEARDMINGFLSERDASVGTVDGRDVIRRRSVPTKKFLKKNLEKDYPEMVAQYTVVEPVYKLEIL